MSFSRWAKSYWSWRNTRCRWNSENDKNVTWIIIFFERICFFNDKIFDCEIILDEIILWWSENSSSSWILFCIRRHIDDESDQFLDVLIQSISRLIHRNLKKILDDFHQMNVLDYIFYDIVVKKKFIIIIISNITENELVWFASISSSF